MNYPKSEIGYLVGVFDIHGSIKIIVPDKANPLDSSLYVWITSKYPELMKFLQIFDAVVSRVSGGQFRAKWKDNNAHRILKIMLPYLIIKKDQAEVGIEFYTNKTNNISPETYVRPLATRLKLLKQETLGE